MSRSTIKMNKLNLVKSKVNFYKLGFRKSEVLDEIVLNWNIYQNRLRRIVEKLSFEGMQYTSKSEGDDSKCKFFITMHYGMYPLLLLYLKNLNSKQKTVILIGKQQSAAERVNLI